MLSKETRSKVNREEPLANKKVTWAQKNFTEIREYEKPLIEKAQNIEGCVDYFLNTKKDSAARRYFNKAKALKMQSLREGEITNEEFIELRQYEPDLPLTTKEVVMQKTIELSQAILAPTLVFLFQKARNTTENLTGILTDESLDLQEELHEQVFGNGSVELKTVSL